MKTALAVASGVLLLVAVASADVPKLISYQGRVTDNAGNPVTDGLHTMRFRLHDAPTGGNVLWDSGDVSQVVTAGVFNATLGAVGQPTLDLDFAGDYWLLVTFEGDDIIPRQRLTSVGYAYMSSGVVPGTEVAGLVAGGAALTGTNTAASGICYGLIGESQSGAGRGVVGIASSTTGLTYGVYGSTSSPSGYGVYSAGDAKVVGQLEVEEFKMPTGAVPGYVLTSDAGGAGTWQATAADDGDWEISGADMYSIPSGNVGVGTTTPAGKLHVKANTWGQAHLYLESSTYGHTRVLQTSGGLVFRNYGATGTDYAFGFRDSTNTTLMSIRADGNVGVGVVNPLEKLVVSGTAQVLGFKMTTGAHTGWVLTSDGTGVASWQPPGGAVGDGDWYIDGNDMYSVPSGDVGVGTTSPSAKLHAETGSDAVALGGVNTAPTGTTYGVYGQAASTDGYGVYSNGNAQVDGDLGVTQSVQVGDSLGVGGGMGAQHATRGVYGEATALTGISYGGRFQAASSTGRGLYGLAASTLGSPIGVYGACNSTMGYGIYFTGGLAGTGTKSCVVGTSEGPTLLYCQESPECWFEDFGEARLANGRAHVELDGLFLETVTIDAGNPMKVFVQLHDEACRGVAVKKGATGFDVVELQGGRSNGTFDYRVVAKRKGYEQDRLELCAAAETDPLLAP